ncbi:SGNH/GDSL hydrolase family protein [Fervidobacterium sp. 2310opik-2]|uniref:SGNH/GDSL hydrolase family protein n=1 Tax=Fervidobacterium sp. 2310opik-2 TaxID=1755815 RepID=UPI000C038A32|nr:SGNH/GDSL hydrolase family protein [Fervidobacterium sp. 2310opik-2]KAF2961147.1 GDSL family lipase [Fervidobacterium sp. 2310opik-2]PHJ13148.1 GDSL family lipase [Fervidobacterium sp. SC_NGM5_G05]
MFVCFGDSITEGKPGVSYVRYLGEGFINKGLGGDTVIGLKKRVEDFLNAENTVDKLEGAIIEIGTNDILLPFLKSYSSGWAKVVDKIIESGRIPSKNIDEFEKYYREIVSLVSDKLLCAISIPCIGEDIEGEMNRKVEKYNEVIKSICHEKKITYVDFNLWQKNMIKKEMNNFNRGKSYFVSKEPFVMVMDSIFVVSPLMTTFVSKLRRLITTIDGVHLNSFAAKELAKMVKESIIKNS